MTAKSRKLLGIPREGKVLTERRPSFPVGARAIVGYPGRAGARADTGITAVPLI